MADESTQMSDAAGGDASAQAAADAAALEAASRAIADATAATASSAESPLSQSDLDAVLASSGLAEPEPAFSMSQDAAGQSAATTAVLDEAPGASPFVPPALEHSPRTGGSDEEAKAIELINDVSLDVKVELGRSRMLVEDVLKLGAGSVVELDKLAGDPVDIFVNERLVAKGEVLVLNDDFCVRISEIITPTAEFSEG